MEVTTCLNPSRQKDSLAERGGFEPLVPARRLAVLSTSRGFPFPEERDRGVESRSLRRSPIQHERRRMAATLSTAVDRDALSLMAKGTQGGQLPIRHA